MRRAQSPKPFAWVFSRLENSENWQGGRERRRWRAQREEERGKWKEEKGGGTFLSPAMPFEWGTGMSPLR